MKAVQRMLGHARASMTLDMCAELFDFDPDVVAAKLGTAIEAAADALEGRKPSHRLDDRLSPARLQIHRPISYLPLTGIKIRSQPCLIGGYQPFFRHQMFDPNCAKTTRKGSRPR